ncbi:hypothetical protein D9758_016928 [Tetrapyrgos nigripes]|uniref:Uncharacterized protein n=1 Tax=Tetrapyrgos nigripes TaxID=182062 RepID=A0A8H5CM59_9AGAR|nr:hypothetical protein D9758_016928 [Tetrapyrgos nigripes]
MADTEMVPTFAEDEKIDIADEKEETEKIEIGRDLLDVTDVGEVFAEGPRLIDLEENDKERPIKTDTDYSMRLISLEDDPSLRINLQDVYFRPQTIAVSSLFLQIISFIFGKVLEEIVPGPSETACIKTRNNRFWRFMNHGPFNLKEHVSITIMASTASTSALAISIFASQDLYYHIRPNAGVGIFTYVRPTLVQHICPIGQSQADKPIFRPIIRLIASQLIGYGMAVYSQLMPTVQLFDDLHRGQDAIMQKKRLRFFWILFIGIFVWEWFPEYIAPIFGGTSNNEGLGMFSICFDWAYVGSGGGTIGTLFTPLSTMLSLYGVCAVCMYVFSGTEYDQLAILNDDFTLNFEKLEEQGLPWYAGAQLLYLLHRTIYIGAAITHFFIWHWGTIYKILKNYWTEECQDPHYRKMKVCKEITNWAYFGIFVVCLALAIGLAYAAKSGLPAWALIIAMLGGALVPGKPVANMYFTLCGENPILQALALLGDLKMGQYTKIPPRVTFMLQMAGTIVGGILNFIIVTTVMNPQHPVLLDLQGTNGALGKPLYATGTRYGFVPYMLLVGLGVPIPFWLAHKRWPKVGFNYVFTQILVAELGFLSVGINSSVFTTFVISVFSQYYLRKYRATWFRKYKYVHYLINI